MGQNATLIWAAQYGLLDIVRLLLDTGADVDAVDEVGIARMCRKRLHWSACRGEPGASLLCPRPAPLACPLLTETKLLNATLYSAITDIFLPPLDGPFVLLDNVTM